MSVPPAKYRAFISPLLGGRMVSNVVLPRLEDEVQKPVLTGRNSKRRLPDIPQWRRARHRDEGAVSGISVGNRREQSIVPQTEAVVSRKRNLWSLRPTMLGLGNDWGCGVENVEVR